MRPILEREIVHPLVCYELSAAQLGLAYFPLREEITQQKLELIADDFTNYVKQKTGELHRFDVKYENDDRANAVVGVVGLVATHQGRKDASKYMIDTAFVADKKGELARAIRISVNDLNSLSPLRPMTLREEMSKVLQLYVKSFNYNEGHN